MQINEGDLKWVAGIVEGEGWFVTNRSTGALLCVAMVDFDTVRKLHSVTGVGRLNVRQPKEKRYKEQLTWTVGKRAELKPLVEGILPFLSERRTQRAVEVLAFIAEREAAARYKENFFKCGHPVTPENTYVVGRNSRPSPSRMCRICTLEKTTSRLRSSRAVARNSRVDVCRLESCDVSMKGRHLNAKFCSDGCASVDRVAKRRSARQG